MPVRDANSVRSGAVQDAFHALPPAEQAVLQGCVDRLASDISNMGMGSALELLAAIGLAMDDVGWPKGEE